MSDPIGGGAMRAWGEAARLGGPQDSGARPIQVLAPEGNADSFADTLSRAIGQVSVQQESAATTLQAFLRGDDVALHQVMAATEEAQISLEMLIEVRNKFAEAYRTLTSMQ